MLLKYLKSLSDSLMHILKESLIGHEKITEEESLLTWAEEESLLTWAWHIRHDVGQWKCTS